jgi:hypothetical protein
VSVGFDEWFDYLQALHAEVAEKGVYVGMLHIGVAMCRGEAHIARDARVRYLRNMTGDSIPGRPGGRRGVVVRSVSVLAGLVVLAARPAGWRVYAADLGARPPASGEPCTVSLVLEQDGRRFVEYSLSGGP